MADSNTTPAAPQNTKGRGAETANDATSGAAPVFRLPKFFTQSAHSTDAHGADEEARDETTAQAAQPTAIQAQVQPVPNAPATASATPATPSKSSIVAAELAEMRDEIERLTEQVTQVNERESSLERVFDTLHAELSDYKNDFLYEHLKPVVRPLLFLFDSIEQFDSEVAMTQDSAPNPTPTPGTLAAFVVRENVEYFRDQLVEALQVCEVTIMEAPRGAFNAKFHKAVDVMPVPREQDGTIVRVVRSGWFLNGQLLRPAEVVVGKFRAPAGSATGGTATGGTATGASATGASAAAPAKTQSAAPAAKSSNAGGKTA